MEKLKSFLENLTKPSKLKVFYRGDFFVVSRKEVVKTSKQRRVDVVLLESDEVRQERFEANVPLGKKEIHDYAILNLEPVLGNRPVSDYYIFAHQLKEPGADGKYYVSVIFFPKQFTEDIFRLGIKGKNMMPIEFCLAGYCKMEEGDKPTIFIYKRGDRVVSLLSIEGFPFEVIKDYVREDEEEEAIATRIISYFLSTYPFLKINTAYLSGFSKVPPEVPGVRLKKVGGYDFLKGVLYSEHYVKIVDFYLESMMDAAALIAIPVFLALSAYSGYKLYSHMDELDSAKEEMKYASDTINSLRTQLLKKKKELLEYKSFISSHSKLLQLAGDVNPQTLIKLEEIKTKLESECKKFKNRLFVERIYLEKRKNGNFFIVEGKIMSDEKKKMYEVVNSLKKLFPGFKSLTNPPRPPSVRFRIEENV